MPYGTAVSHPLRQSDTRPGRRAARYLGALLACAVLLAGCALVDDARREFGSEPDRETGSAARPEADPTAGDPPPLPGGPYGNGEPSGEPSSQPSGQPSGLSGGCPPSGVLVRTGEVDAAMGLRAMGIELVNCGSVPFTVNGYPGVRVLDDARAPLPVTVGQGSSGVAAIDGFDTPPAPVTAAPGERLVAGLVWRNRVDMAVEPVNGTYLEIVPAPGQPPQTVRPEGRIDLGTTGRMGVTAWSAARR
jgi:hypothetical protein